MKRILIISPYFPPANAADMQRVRMSLPYFAPLGWEAEVVTVDEKFIDINKDELLLASIPPEIKVHQVKAFNKKWTSKVGLGSIALRSLYYYRQKVNELLKKNRYDIIYFSTTQFPVCILGSYWKKRFGIPYVIDMQDPWHSDYYQDKPKEQRPAKYWFSYRLNKYLEPKAIKNADGLISVSESYISDLQNRYPEIKNRPAATITFGAFGPDVKIARQQQYPNLLLPGYTNIVYIGRGGADMHAAIKPLFEALKAGLKSAPQLFSKIRLYFIGTSYAQAGHGQPTIMPLAKQLGVANYVIEITNRISYYHTLHTLQQANALFIPGSDDPKYTASKIYPYLLTKKPLLGIFNEASSAIGILKTYGVRQVYAYQTVGVAEISDFLSAILNGAADVEYNADAVAEYSAKNMVIKQIALFNQVLQQC